MKKIFIVFFIFGLILISACTKTVPCGGWNMAEQILCECDGEYNTTGCPTGMHCENGNYYCQGTCGECKCYVGPESLENEIPCNGRDEIYK